MRKGPLEGRGRAYTALWQGAEARLGGGSADKSSNGVNGLHVDTVVEQARSCRGCRAKRALGRRCAGNNSVQTDRMEDEQAQS